MSAATQRFLAWLVAPVLEHHALENQIRHKTGIRKGDTQ
jgi:hypothetical protein